MGLNEMRRFEHDTVTLSQGRQYHPQPGSIDIKSVKLENSIIAVGLTMFKRVQGTAGGLE